MSYDQEKSLHSSTWRTESDSGVLVDVAEGRTADRAPFREIEINAHANMTPAEARRLIADLQHAVALAEDQPADAKPRQHPLTEYCFHCASDNMLARGIQRHDEGKLWDGPTVHMQTPASFCPRMDDEPAVSENQPKPRMWRFGDPEPRDCGVVRDNQHDVWTRRVIQGEELWTSPDTAHCTWHHITKKWGPVSEVLADSEQATR